MASEIFVFTAAGAAARRHREETIERPVPLDRIEARAARIASSLTSAGQSEVRCWGSVPGPGNLRSWRRMQPGHWALLYGGDESFPWLLRVCATGRSKALARDLWGQDSDGRTWELMFFFDLALRVDLGLDEVRNALAYRQSEWRPQGLQYPRAKHQEALIESFGSIEGFALGLASAPSQKRAIAPSPDELMYGGAFTRAPDKPPRRREIRQPPDPDRTGRGWMAHERTVEKLARYVGPAFRKGNSRGINHDGTWKVDGAFAMVEVKSITPENQVGQLQKGLGQILHNAIKAEEGGVEVSRAYLIAECEPRNSALWRRLANRHGIVFSWPDRFEEDVERP